jgi:predicted kinase
MATVLLAVAGTSGAGKERFAGMVAQRIGARLVKAVSGRELPGVDPGSMPDADEYAALTKTAKMALDAGQSVVIAAPFHTRDSRRELMKLACDARAALLYVECSSNATVRRRRLRSRLVALGGSAELEARLDRILEGDLEFEPVLREIPRACQMLIDTTVGIDLWAGLAAGRLESYLAARDAGETATPAIQTG